MDEQHGDIGVNASGAGTTTGVVPLLLTIPQAAYVLAVGRTTVYELIGAGDLEAVHIGRSVRIPIDALQSFVNRRASSARTAGTTTTESSRPRPPRTRTTSR